MPRLVKDAEDHSLGHSQQHMSSMLGEEPSDISFPDLVFYSHVGREIVHLLMPLSQEHDCDTAKRLSASVLLKLEDELARLQKESDSLRLQLQSIGSTSAAARTPAAGRGVGAELSSRSDFDKDPVTYTLATSGTSNETWRPLAPHQGDRTPWPADNWRPMTPNGDRTPGSSCLRPLGGRQCIQEQLANSGRQEPRLSIRTASTSGSRKTQGSSKSRWSGWTGVKHASTSRDVIVRDRSGKSPMSVSEREQVKSNFMAIFQSLDEDSSGRIHLEELRHAFRIAGQSPASARKLLLMGDTNFDGAIDRKEWEASIADYLDGKNSRAGQFAESCLKVLGGSDPGSLRPSLWSAFSPQRAENDGKRIEHLRTKLSKIGTKETDEESTGRVYCIIQQHSLFRMCWETGMAILLVYVALVTPFEIGFLSDESKTSVHSIFTLGVDVIFILDVFLNFRTSYVDDRGCDVVNGKLIALHYVKTWFLIDFISSFPFDWISGGSLPGLHVTKLSKTGKILKIFKMWRLARMANLSFLSHFMDSVQDYLAVQGGFLFFHLLQVLLFALLIFHWLACCMPLVGDGFINTYQNVNRPTLGSKYGCAVYWAVATITSTGYGDILPTNDAERTYATFAMVLGGVFYGFVIGDLSVLLASRNLNTQAYRQHLSQVRAWLDHHHFPKHLRHRVWRYFRQHLKMKSASDEFNILTDLSSELRHAVSLVIVHEYVRHNTIFDEIPTVLMAHLADIIKKIVALSAEPITSYGDFGYAMGVFLEGSAVIDRSGKPIKSHEDAMNLCQSALDSQVLLPSDSYGEEIVLGLERQYWYSVVALKQVTMAMIPAEEFMRRFGSTPEMMQKMRANFAGNASLPGSRPASIQAEDSSVASPCHIAI